MRHPLRSSHCAQGGARNPIVQLCVATMGVCREIPRKRPNRGASRNRKDLVMIMYLVETRVETTGAVCGRVAGCMSVGETSVSND